MSRYLLILTLAGPAFAQSIEITPERLKPAPVVAKPGDKSLLKLFPPQKPLPLEQVQPLLDALASPDFKTREKASKELLNGDERALPHLIDAMGKTDSPEAHRRLEVLVGKLKRERVLRPTRVTVKADGQTPKAVLKDICRQAGYTLVGEPNDGGRVKLDLADVPFWEAVEKVCGPHGITVAVNNDAADRGVLSAYGSGSLSPYTHTTGPFRFVAQSINTNKSVQLSDLSRGGGSPRSEYISFSGAVWSEPKLPMVAVGQVRLTKATDDQGASMLDPNADANAPPPDERLGRDSYYRTHNQSFSLALVRGGKEATSIKELRGVLPVAVLVDVRAELEVEDVSKVKGKKFAGRAVDVEVHETTEANGTVSVKLTLTPRVTPQEGDNYSWWSSVPQRLVLVDEDGTRFVNAGVTDQVQAAAAVTMTAQFQPPEGRKKMAPASLLLTYWVTEQRDVEFAFKDVPLP